MKGHVFSRTPPPPFYLHDGPLYHEDNRIQSALRPDFGIQRQAWPQGQAQRALSYSRLFKQLVGYSNYLPLVIPGEARNSGRVGIIVNKMKIDMINLSF